MTERTGHQVEDLLSDQLADFRKLYELNLAQHDSIVREDMHGLERLFVSMHGLMGSIRSRQASLVEIDECDAETREKRDQLAELITEISDLCRQNQAILRTQMAATQQELRDMGKRRRAASGYNPRRYVTARLVDGSR